MNQSSRIRDGLLVLAGALLCLVLRGGAQPATAAGAAANLPFASATKQRNDMLRELQTLNRRVDEQTRFLQSGKLKVVIELRDVRTKPRK